MGKEIKYFSRRDFVKFMGGTSVLVYGLSASALVACASKEDLLPEQMPFEVLSPLSDDSLQMAGGLKFKILIADHEPLNTQGLKFGTNADFTTFIPMQKSGEGWLWVNHEHFISNFLHKKESEELKKGKTIQQVNLERKCVGGSLLHVKQGADGHYSIVKNSPQHKRLDGTSKIDFAWPEKIKGQSYAEGTLANCAGGKTPYGTILTCEENYDLFVGETDPETGKHKDSKEQWEKFYKLPPEHYGWVVEYNPKSGKAKKLVGMGRFSHECATVTQAPDGRLVVYTGDDDQNQFLYKYISKNSDGLEEGDLYVADTENGKWILVSWNDSPLLQKSFANQTEVLISCRKAAAMLGATPLDRPEDIEVHPKTGDVYIALSNNKPKDNYYGQILKLVEDGNNPLSLIFEASTFFMGGLETGVACPDNMIFDKNGNLWVTTDISGGEMGKGKYESFKNNGLFYIPLSGPFAGQAFQMASAPINAEFTGPTFSPDNKVLFLCVQHPGEKSESWQNPLSHWPKGGNELPQSAVVQIYGEAFDQLMLKGLGE